MLVSPERLAGWAERFAARHGGATWDAAVLRGGDGASAEVDIPFPPARGDVVAHCAAPRRVGVLLVRLGGHAAGVFDGDRLVASKVGHRQVHGRNAAGGWSQQRFARRREGQVAAAHASAADAAARVLLPEVAGPSDAGRPPGLAGLLLGGDRTAVDAVLTDRRLAPLLPLVTGRLLDVPDPRQAVLESLRWRDVRIRVLDPPAS